MIEYVKFYLSISSIITLVIDAILLLELLRLNNDASCHHRACKQTGTLDCRQHYIPFLLPFVFLFLLYIKIQYNNICSFYKISLKNLSQT